MNLSRENITWLYVRAFADEFARAGAYHVCLCPGSRSTPLAMTFAEHPAFRLWMHLDERSCAFFALGLAKASRKPVILICTSGTAAANFLPAIVEASLAHVPLIVLTSDRPHELRDTGAPQTIDQIKLYGDYAKWFAEIALPEATAPMLRYARTMANRAVAKSLVAPAGVVHFNLPFREPLIPLRPELEADVADRDAFFGRPDGKPFAAITQDLAAPDPNVISALATSLAQTERGLIVAGMQNDDAFPPALVNLAAKLGYPILADPLSQVRSGAHERTNVIDAYDGFLRDPHWVKQLAPQVVLRFGAVPTSKPVLQYLQAHAASQQILIDNNSWNDPAQITSEMLAADPTRVCNALAATIPNARKTTDWLSTWHHINNASKSAIKTQLETYSEMFEGRVFVELAALLADGAVCFAGSSMPVRDMDTFFPSSPQRIRFLSNRGANGIDGVVSTALGAGAATTGPLVLVIGDLALYHDMNGLLAAAQYQLNALIVLIDNDGGGIFSFLPQAEYPEQFEKLFGTPHGLNFRHTADLYGATFTNATDWETFRSAVRDGLRSPGLKIVRVKTNRQSNVTMHRAIWQAVSQTLIPISPPPLQVEGSRG